jgi:hypothetical protein
MGAPKKLVGFQNERIANELVRMVESNASNPQSGKLLLPKTRIKQLHTYVVETKTIITAPTSASIVGSGIAYIMQRSYETDNPISYWLVNNEKVEVKVFNLRTGAIPAGRKLLAAEDMDGDLWVIDHPTILKGVVTESGGIAFGTTGEVTIWQNGAEADPVWTEQAAINWMHNDQNLNENDQVIIQWFQDELDGLGQYVVTNSQCQPLI